MATDQNQSTPTDAESVTAEPEAQPDSVRPTDTSENLDEAIVEEEASRPPQGA